jgi:hypothetical protein
MAHRRSLVSLTYEALMWRRSLLALCGITIAATATFIAIAPETTSLGLRFISSAGTPYLERVTVGGLSSRERAAAKAGLRSGDVVDIRPMSPGDRFRFFNNLAYRGEPVALYRSGNGALERIVVVGNEPLPLEPTEYLTFAAWIWLALFGAVLAWKRPDSWETRILVLFLAIFPLSALLYEPPIPGFGNAFSPWALFDCSLAALGAILGFSNGLLIWYSMRFGQPASRLRRSLMWLGYGSITVAIAFNLLQLFAIWNGAPDPRSLIFTDAPALWLTSLLPWAFIIACGVATAQEARGIERQRYLWAFVPLVIAFFIYATEFPALVVGLPYALIWIRIGNWLTFLAPLGLTYSLLSKRLLDIGFVLNRAVVFSVVSFVVLGVFVVVEWLLGDWMKNASHSTNLIVAAGVALVLGISIRTVHSRIERFVDSVFFRKRRDDEQSILKMAREAPYITDTDLLVARVRQTLLEHTNASAVDILINDLCGRYGGIDENDPAFVQIRSDHTIVDLDSLDTAIDGEWGFPMVARGRVMGAIVLGAKRSEEAYAPDEFATILQLAHSVGGALVLLSPATAQDAGIGARLDQLSAQVAALDRKMSERFESV